MNKKTVAVVFGGCSPEYDVSLNSSYSIIDALDREKYEVILLGITRDGAWYRYSGPKENIPNDTWQSDVKYLKNAFISPVRGNGIIEIETDCVTPIPVDIIFPVMHGENGEDGTLQGLCEMAGLPLVGSGSAASALCMDKDRAHKLVSLAGLRVPKSVCFEVMPNEDELLETVRPLGLPIFVKPVNAGSSIGITMVDDYSRLMEAVCTAFEYDRAVIIEENITGFEAGCAVVGNLELQTGRIDEIELADGFFTYEEKYTLKTSKIHVPARVDADTERRLQEAAMLAYKTLGCRGYCRVDLFLTKEGEIVFNEANTIPGFTSHSRFPSMMKAAGVDFPTLIDMLIDLGFENAR